MKQVQILFFLLFLFKPGVNAQKPAQDIRGTVVDAHSREKLFGANIVLVKENKGTITDEDGNFILENIPVGRYELHVSFIGYEPVVIPELLVGSGKEVILAIMMEASYSKLEEVVIKPQVQKDRPINSMANVSARTFSVEEASRYAGALDDPGRMAGNFAGVSTVGISVNAVVVRGNAPKGLSWRLEGVDIPVPSHFSGSNVAGGGGLTMFSSQLLANSDFYTGAFPAQFGNATAGVFDMKLRNGNNRRREYAFQLGVQGIEAAAEGPFAKSGQGSYLFNYRYSTMALIFPLLPEVSGSNELPIYQDLSFKLNFPAGKAGTFSLWGIGGLSKSTMDGNDDANEWVYQENRAKMAFHYNMGAVGISHSKSLSSKTFLQTNLALTVGQHIYDEKSRLYESRPTEIFPLFAVENTSGILSFSPSITHTASHRFTLKTGIDASNHFYNLTGDARDFQTESMNTILEGTGNAFLLKGYFQGKYMLTPEFSIIAGANASWFELNKRFRLEPRISASWQAHPDHWFSLGYGNHSQTEPLFIYFVTHKEQGENHYPNNGLKRMGAHHYVLGYDWSVNRNLHLKIEPYYQDLYDVPVVDNSSYSMVNFLSDWTFDRALVNKGTGRNMGIDLTLERYLMDGYYYMTTASVYKSEYTGGDGVTRRSRYDGGYVMNILGGKEWTINDKNLLGINLKFTFMGPHWYHPVNVEETQLTGDIVYDESQPFVDRYSNFESITDLAVKYRINGNRLSSVLMLQVRNILGRQYMGKKYNLELNKIENDFFTSPVPFISYKVEF